MPSSDRNAVANLLLGLDPLVQVALVGDRLDLLDSERRLPGELAGPGEGGVEEFLVGDQVVGEAMEARLRGEDRVPVRFISSAFEGPTSRGSCCVPPKPGMIPRLISG